MEVKEWFQRGRRIDKRIDSLILQRREEWDRITSITAAPDGVTVDGTRDPHQYDGYAVLCEQIDEELTTLYKIKAEIRAVVARIPDYRYRDVLEKRYVAGKSWEQIAVDMSYTYRRITQLHGEALKIAEEIIQNERCV